MTRDTDRRSESGFTLVEALVAIVILVFGLIAVTNLLLVAVNSNVVANRATAATTIAAQQLETLKAVPFDQLAPGGSLTADEAGFFRDETVNGVGVIHTRWEVVPNPGDAQVVFIKVSSEGTGLARQLSKAEFTTLRTCTNRLIGCPAP